MDPVSHILFPALVALSLKFDPKKVFSLLPFAILPDLDVIFGLSAHRVLFHNFIFVIVLPLVVFIYIRKEAPGKLSWMGMGWFFLISHIILDLQSGFSFFWPISRKAPYISLEVGAEMGAIFPRISLILDYGIASGPPEFTGEATILPATTFLVVLLVSFGAIVNRKKVISFSKDFINFCLDKLYSLIH